MTNKNIKGFLFDFNGTLFFDSELHIRAFKKYFTEHGKEEPTAEFITKNIFGRPNPRIYSDNFNPNPTEEEWMEFDELLEARGSEEFGFDVDWLNARHFDFRGLIEKNLAIAVTEENNPYKR
jgi:phosphoglycolate phosphatase-like HAD superfamily hydrolase